MVYVLYLCCYILNTGVKLRSALCITVDTSILERAKSISIKECQLGDWLEEEVWSDGKRIGVAKQIP